MRDEDIRRPAQELEILVAEGRLRTRINGSSTYASVPLDVPADCISRLQQTYRRLDELTRQDAQGWEYREKERELGELLAGILLQDVPGLARDRQLGAVLDACLCTLHEGEYVRLLLSFEDASLSNLPWELALWKTARREMCLGRDRRIALSRLEHGRAGIRRKHVLGSDHVLSLLHIDTVRRIIVQDGSPGAGQTQYAITRDFLQLIDDHIARLHAASRTSEELDTYWLDSDELTGQPAEVDIVHWDGHGGTTGAEMTSAAGDEVTITAAELFERTRNAFLYVVRACGATGKMPDGVSGAGATGTSSSLSIDLLDAGAPAVLGTHDSVLPTDLAYLPIIYPLLLQGLPLDYCAQYMRRFFSRRNADRRNGPFEPWYKLMLRTTSTWYLDAAPACTRAGSRRDPIAFVTALCRKFEQLQQAAGGDRERDEQKSLLLAPGEGGTAPEALDDVLKQLYDAELMD